MSTLPNAPQEAPPARGGKSSLPLSQNIDAVAALKLRAERRVSPNQRAVEALTAYVGRPSFFLGVLVTVVVWIIANLVAPHFNVPRWDEPPFAWLQGIIGLGALLITIMILITQNRQGEITARLEHLDLQMSMLTEQKAAKIIELLEEMRRDSPTLPDRVDPEAEALQEASDPEIILTALEFKLEQALDNAVELEQMAIKTEIAAEEAIEEVANLREERLPGDTKNVSEPR